MSIEFAATKLSFNSPLECNFATKVKPMKIKSSKYITTIAYFSVQKEEIINNSTARTPSSMKVHVLYKETKKQESKCNKWFKNTNEEHLGGSVS